ncbi:MAG: radical SAM protein [Elusimicrobiota bacterium]
MKILKEKTKSICPECFGEIEGRVLEKDNSVYLEKECRVHGKFSIVVEKNPDFYMKVMNPDYTEDRVSYTKLALPVTYRCNMRCPMCYEPDRSMEDPPIDYLLGVISEFSGELVKLTGGEPTLREDLPVLIKAVKEKGMRCSLVTNGLKLADYKYVKTLKLAGLENVALSFSSLNDEIYKQIRGQELLKIKLQALKNLKKVGIGVALSMTLVRGINERELKKIYEYYLYNRSFVRLLRLRSMSCVGRFIDTAPFSVFEIIHLLSDASGFTEEELMESNSGSSGDDHAACRFDVSAYGAFCSRITKGGDSKNILSMSRALIKSFRVCGFKQTWSYLYGCIWKPEYWCITIRSWPDKNRLDLGEIKRCPTAVLTKEGKLAPFCETIIRGDTKCL